jgi:hypothetical protein
MIDLSATMRDDDEYAAVLARLGRSEVFDARVLVHEISHFTVNRILSNGPSVLVSVDPDPELGIEGICRGERAEAFTNADGSIASAAEVREQLRPKIPGVGEDRSASAELFQNTFDDCTELMAGEAGETLLMPGPATLAGDDRRQVRELARLFCKSPEAAERFIDLCAQQALDLLRPYVPIIVAVREVLRIRRTMTGDEIDGVIAEALARETVAVEHQRREQWRQRVDSANQFTNSIAGK